MTSGSTNVTTTNNANPLQPTLQDIVNVTIGGYPAAIREAILEVGENGPGLIKGVRFFNAATMSLIDIAVSLQTENVFQATVTGVGTVAITMGVTAGLTGGAAFMASAVVGLVVGRCLDATWTASSALCDTIYWDYKADGKLDITANLFHIDDLLSIANYFQEGVINTLTGIEGMLASFLTFGNLAQKYNKTLDELLTANPWLADRTNADKSFVLIKPGDLLTIPGEGEFDPGDWLPDMEPVIPPALNPVINSAQFCYKVAA